MILLFALLLATPLLAQSKLPNAQVSPLVIGDKIEFESRILQEPRVLNVYLPHGYSPDSAKTYPVIYVLDGTINEDFLHIAGLVQFYSFPWLEKMPECIVVGIANGNRYHDFTYPTDKPEYQEINPDAGGSALFMEFLEKEVKPYINKNYRVQEPATLIGQSLGGLLATEILFKKPDLFDNYIIVSPSLWWDEESLFQVEPKKYSSQKKIFIAVGKEGKVMKSVAKKLYKDLKKDESPNTTVGFQYFPQLDHGDALHLAVYEALGFVF